VVEAVDRLPEPYRTAVVERYLEGLPARAVALRQGVTPATVRNRLREALRLLRGEIGRRHGAAWPAFLAPLAAPTEAGAAAAVTGGVLMMKGKLVVAGLLAAGIAVGWIMPWGKRPRAETARATAPGGEAAALAAERDRLLADNARLEERVAELERRAGGEGGALAAQGDADTAGAATARSAPARGEEAAPGGIDWKGLEAAIAGGRETIARMAETDREKKSMRTLSPEDQAVAQELILAWNSAAAKARTVTPHPTLDARFLPKIVGTMVDGMLDLEPAQRDRIERELEALLASTPDPLGLTPVEAYGLRRKVMAEADARIDAILDAKQKETWRSVEPLWGALREGNRRAVLLGLRTGDPARHVAREFATHYQLTEAQQPRAQEIANRYVDEGREVLRRFGQLGDAPAALDAEARGRLDGALRDLQLRAEKEILPLLAADQMARLRRQLPVLISFEDTANVNIDASDDRGF
jgi:hypothetical protein